MSADIPGLVETSTNLGVITTDRRHLGRHQPAQFGGD